MFREPNGSIQYGLERRENPEEYCSSLHDIDKSLCGIYWYISRGGFLPSADCLALAATESVDFDDGPSVAINF
jgi:hypothetical protein